MNATLATVLAMVAAAALSALEWRRPNRRHRAFRIGATLLAVGALALMGWRPAWRHPNSPGSTPVKAALWTPGAYHDVGNAIDARYRFTLPDVNAPTPATLVPDAATARRRLPATGELHVFGEGLDQAGLEAFRGWRVVFLHESVWLDQPAIRFLRCPRTLALGEPLVVQGQISGLRTGATATVTLEAPDGTSTDATSAAGFTVESAPAPAAGRFVWRLRVGKTDVPLGVEVVPPDLPRVLVLAGAPRFDTAALRHWFENAGGTLAARTLVGQGRYRFESAHDPPPQFTALDAPLLAGYDLVLADGRALAALPPPEQETLRAAITGTGLGLLVLADDANLAATPFFPWKLAPLPDAAGEGDRLTRVQWPGQPRAIEIPVPSAPFEIVPQAGQTLLTHDSQGHALAAAAACGRGQMALTLVRETDRWTRANDPAAFAAYWSALFSTLARKTGALDAGRWTLADGDAGPVFVDAPVDFVWSGPAATAGIVTAETGADGGVPVPLARDPAEPGRWRGRFWPRRGGWHRVSMPTGGRALDFFVTAAGDWPALEAARRQATTARFAEESAGTTVPAVAGIEDRTNTPASMGGWFALFLLGAGYLWIERRQSTGARPSL